MVVLRDRPDGVVAGAYQDAATALVGSVHQRHLHVLFRAALCRRRSALAAQPQRLGGVCPTVRRVVFRRARRLHRSAGRTAVGRSPLHPGRHRRRPVQPALHVQKSRRCPRRRAAGRHAQKPGRRSPLRGADLDSRLGNAASAIGRSTAQLGTGQRESGRGDSLAACRSDRDDLGVPVAPRQAHVAAAAGGLPVGDGIRAGVLGRALRDRHPAGLGARRDRVGGVRSSRRVVVPASRVEVSRRRLD
jgi:hypothetical protein